MSDNSPTGTQGAAAAVFEPAAAPTNVPASTPNPTPSQVTPAASPTPAATPTATPAAPAGVSREDIQAIVQSVASAVAPKPQPTQLSQAEIDQALRVYRPSAKLVESILAGGEGAVQALHEIVNGTATHAMTVANIQLQDAIQRLEARLNPIQSHIREQQESALKSEFIAAHPNLKGFDPVLKTVYEGMVREGLTFPNKKEAFAEVAKRADAIIKSLPGIGQSAAPAGQATGQTHSMSTLTGGGQGGSGTTGQSTAEKPLGLRVFDK